MSANSTKQCSNYAITKGCCGINIFHLCKPFLLYYRHWSMLEIGTDLPHIDTNDIDTSITPW